MDALRFGDPLVMALFQELTVVVMIVGFALICVGVATAFRNEAAFHASLLSAASGVIVSFIGGTFLVIYRATMAQARDYVTILERINAVGMSVQILDTIAEDPSRLKHITTAEVAKQLLRMYSLEPESARNRSREPRV